ncbi:Septin-type guanine nucleotide-binding (G) domain-containing protein [Globomyces pollinis-pini]|nr:Septin-type guanine nucleotide-binding (G) domain-containing protein [Globomyces pollinis-pini]
MVAGHYRTGKSDFIQTLFDTLKVHKLVTDDDAPVSKIFPEDVTFPTPSSCRIECDDAYQTDKISLQIIDCPGLDIPAGIIKPHSQVGNQLDKVALDYANLLLEYIENQFRFRLAQENLVRRNPKAIDTQVHSCLYFLNPDVILGSKGLTRLDRIVLEKLCTRVNIVPCLAKSDLVTVRDLRLIRDYLYDDFHGMKIPIFNFRDEEDDEEDQDSIDVASKVPFCIVNSEELSNDGNQRVMGILINDQKVLGREYIWGSIEVENPDHCDFDLLVSVILGSHIDDLRISTREKFYELWRTENLTDGQVTLKLPEDLRSKVSQLTMDENNSIGSPHTPLSALEE